MGRVIIVGSYIVALVMDMDRLPVEGETVAGRLGAHSPSYYNMRGPY